MLKAKLKKASVLLCYKVTYETSERRQRAQLSGVYIVKFYYFGGAEF